jgi:hypothetical protein
MAYVYPILLGSCTFWLLSFILILACLVPDCAFNVLQNYTPEAYAKLQKVRNSFDNSKAVSYNALLPRISNIFSLKNSSDVKYVDFVVLKTRFPFINFTWYKLISVAFTVLFQKWKCFAKKKRNHYSFNRSNVQTSSTRHASLSFNGLNVQRPSCSR